MEVVTIFGFSFYTIFLLVVLVTYFGRGVQDILTDKFTRRSEVCYY